MQVIRLREVDRHALTRQVTRGGHHMSKEERKKLIEAMAEKFIGMDAEDKALIVGYQLGKQEERQRWELKESRATAMA
jgi:hypothetical protein